MARSQLSMMPTAARSSQPSLGSSVSKDPIHDMQQFDKIIQLHDAIVAGLHPTIKVPPHLAGKLASLAVASPSLNKADTLVAGRVFDDASLAQLVSNVQSFSSNSQGSIVPGLGASATPAASAGAVIGIDKAQNSQNTEINPIFLEKSDDLIRAEIQLQRQRLERALRDEVEQRRVAQKASAQAEAVADFDLHDVLSKALTLVQATTITSTTAAPADAKPAANEAAASDSFDENSYYSSQQNSPDASQASSHAGREADGEQMQEMSEPQPPTAPRAQQAAGGTSQPASLSSSSRHLATYQQQGQAPTSAPFYSIPQPSYDVPPASENALRVPSFGGAGNDNNHTTGESTSVGERSGEASGSDSANIVAGDRNFGRSAPQAGQPQLGESLLHRPPSPVVVAQDLAPVAPQPSRVSPLAIAHRPNHQQHQQQQRVHIPQGTSAQVAALRNEPNVISSPDSSPQGARKNDKKKGKKDKKEKNNKNNKRAARQAADVPSIKEEPRSPSPMSAPQFTRPQKRQKRQAENEPSSQLLERQPSRSYRDEGLAPVAAYPTPSVDRSQLTSRAAFSSGYGYGGEYVEDRRVASTTHPYPTHYGSAEVYAPASAPPPPMPAYDEGPQRIYRESYEPGRVSVRPEVSRVRSRSPVYREFASPMGPPRAAPPRIIVDAHGRRYYEPQPQPVPVRQSVPPAMRADDAEIIYERPLRAESRRPEYGSASVVYQRSSPLYSTQRRIVTQPEYSSSDSHRAYREREYSSRPMPPPPMEQYVQIRSGAEPRPREEVPLEYTMRATTARPAESVRYEMPREYERIQSIRPDLPSQAAYPPSGSRAGEMRHEVAQPTPRAYSVRPAEPPQVARQEFAFHPADQYYGQPTQTEDVTYMGSARGVPQEMMYGQDPRQAMYRQL